MSESNKNLFLRLAEPRLAAKQVQLDRARQLLECYRNAQDSDELIPLQQEFLAILGRQDDNIQDGDMTIAAWFSAALYHEHGITIDSELFCRLLNRLHPALLR